MTNDGIDVTCCDFDRNLGNAMELDGLRETEPLTRALSHTGDTYEKIATICEDQPRLDLEPMGDVLHDYRGLLASFPDIITVHRVYSSLFHPSIEFHFIHWLAKVPSAFRKSVFFFLEKGDGALYAIKFWWDTFNLINHCHLALCYWYFLFGNLVFCIVLLYSKQNST